MTKQLASVLAITLLAALTTKVAQAQITPGPLYDFRASDNAAHPDGFANLGDIGGELGIQGLAPIRDFDTFWYYNVDADDGSFDILDGGDGVIIEDGFTYEMLLRRNGPGYGSEDQIAAIAEGGGKKIFLSRASQGVSMLLFSDNGGGAVREIGHSNIMELPAGEWTHFVISYNDETDVGKVYVNGGAPSTLDFTGIELNEDPADLVTLFKTRGSESGNRRLQGDISEARLYDFVLTDEQARANYDVFDPDPAPGFQQPPSRVGPRGEVGVQPVTGSFANQVFTEPTGSAPGLAQSWYGSSGPTGRNRQRNKEGVDLGAQLNDRALPMFHAEDGTWWTGNYVVTDVEPYPVEVLDANVIETEGGDEGLDFYYTKLEGEILIPEGGNVRFIDGVDAYAYLAIDTDRSGIAGDSESEVLLNDDDWTDALAQQPPPDDGDPPPPIVEVNMDGVGEGGEWVAIEFNMLEVDGGDSAMLYWDALDEDGAFPTEEFVGVQDDDAAALQVPDTHLRGPTTPAMHVSSDVVGTLPERRLGWEVDVNPSDGTADMFSVEDLGVGREEIDSADLTRIMDVEGAEFHINPLGDVTEGDSFRIIDADRVTGTPIIVTEGWSFDASTGSVIFGATLNCDINGDGVCDAADIDAMTQMVIDGTATQEQRTALIESAAPDGLNTWIGDSDMNGEFNDQDFVAVFIGGKYITGEQAGWVDGDWDGNFLFNEQDFVAAFVAGGYLQGQRGAVASVPEPSSLVLLALGMLALIRRRR